MKEMLVGNPLLFAISDPLPWVSGKPILGSAGKFVVDKQKPVLVFRTLVLANTQTRKANNESGF